MLGYSRAGHGELCAAGGTDWVWDAVAHHFLREEFHEGLVHDEFFLLKVVVFCRVGFYPARTAGVPVAAEVHISVLHDTPVV